MRIRKTIQNYAFVAVLIGMVTLLSVGETQASIATDTADALASNPDGGYGLELAIGQESLAPCQRRCSIAKFFLCLVGCCNLG